jgi:hypothetical protein
MNDELEGFCKETCPIPVFARGGDENQGKFQSG